MSGETVKAIRGMNDLLPESSGLWQQIESVLRQVFANYAYQEIRPNLIEKTTLFKRSIGDETDIVSKEMYSFEDRNNDSLTLRPEGTAGCVRAAIEHALAYNQTQRLWMMGPMFRYERPQKGRYRQFHQAAAEVFGIEGPDVDAELILLTRRLWQKLGIADKTKLKLNSLGDADTRTRYRLALVDYFESHRSALDEDSLKRLSTNPLRILDSKNPDLKSIIDTAPVITDYLSDSSQEHFEALKNLLAKAGVTFELNPKLVRGLDYYNRTVFEWSTDLLGAQDAICGGGRYDGLFEQLGGRATPAVGFAIGLERLIELVKMTTTKAQKLIDIYIVSNQGESRASALLFAEKIRDTIPSLVVKTHTGSGGFKSQFKQADKAGAELALIFGETEIESNHVTIKHLRTDEPQITLDAQSAIQSIAQVTSARRLILGDNNE